MKVIYKFEAEKEIDNCFHCPLSFLDRNKYGCNISPKANLEIKNIYGKPEWCPLEEGE